jgi:hypothetical protein
MIYIDNKHMVADSKDELRQFAISLGLGGNLHGVRKNHPHVDLFDKRLLAIDKGAIVVRPREILRLSKIMK